MKYFFLGLISLLSVFIIWINIKLHTGNNTKEKQKEDILLQLNYLETELKQNNLGEKMQVIYPEGYVFINALYGLSWCELALSDSLQEQNIKEKAINEALYAYKNIDSDKGKIVFSTNIEPKFGAFYCGWKNYLLSKILSIDTVFKGSYSYIDSFKVQCRLIANALVKSETPFLESYPNQSWPADMFVTMASLSNYNKVFDPEYEGIIVKWITKVREKTDSLNGLIPHKVDSKTAAILEGARGCSMSLILRMLYEIETIFAKEQFELFKNNFTSSTCGLPSVREYPKGKQGKGDVDSGPVIFGIGFASTIVTIGTYSVCGHGDLAIQQYQTVNTFGFPNIAEGRKSYLFEKVPMADAFIAWGRASGLKYYNNSEKNNSILWALNFHLISVSVIILMYLFYFRKKVFAFLKR